MENEAKDRFAFDPLVLIFDILVAETIRKMEAVSVMRPHSLENLE